MRRMRPRDVARGQILVLFTLLIVGMLVMTGLVVEGGNVFGQQRIAQNGADAAANAGAVVIAQKLAGQAKTGADVLGAVSTSVSANGLATTEIDYTDGFGTILGPVTSDAIPSTARGVHIGGDRVVQTTLIRIIGFNELTASADATAVAGALKEAGRGAIPVTFPTLISDCEGRYFAPGSEIWPTVGTDALDQDNMAIIPLCVVDPASVGWLDLGDGNLLDQITNGPTISVNIPDWVQTQTGNINSSQVENAINNLRNPVLIPMFDGTCRVDPGDASSADTCPTDKKGTDPSGNNTWYHIPYFTSFWVYEAYTNGNNVNSCATGPGEPTIDPRTSGFLGCIKGWFVEWVYEGPIDPNREITAETSIGIQLIK